MTVLIKLAYGAAVAALLVLLTAFGVRAFYGAPEPPDFPEPPFTRPPVVVPPTAGAEPATPTAVTPTPDDLARYEQAQRDYQRSYERYEGERQDYRRNVLLACAAIAILAIVGGAALWSRMDAMSLGFIAGGFATLLYGIIQAAGDLDDVSPALIFVVALVGLGAVLAAGYRWLSER